MRRWLAALFLLLSTAAWAGDGLVPLPALSARVTDLTHTLSADQSGSLESQLAGIEGETGAQVAVLLLPSTQPEAIEQFGIRLAEAWKIGHKGKDNGVIVIVAKSDRKVRIEVGYGLEGPLNDATCQRLIREYVAPRFKANDYYGGLQVAVAGILAAIKTDMPAAGADQAAEQNASPVELDRVDRALNWFDALGTDHESIFWILIGGVLIGITALKFFLGDFLGSSVIGGLTGIAAFFLTLSLVAALIAAVVGFLFALIGINIIWSAILSGGSGGSGGSSGGGGFSGGGGGFGGGGSSGSW
jgi:uncharacterized protein